MTSQPTPDAATLFCTDTIERRYMTQISYCASRACKTQMGGDIAQCPTCGGKMVRPGVIRQIGWILAVVGGLITVPMVFVILKFLPVAVDPAQAVAAGRFGGTADQVPAAMGLLISVFAFGAAMLGFGLHRALTGRRNAVLKPVVLLLGMLFLAMFFYFGSQLPDTPSTMAR